MPAHSPAPLKQATIALSYESSWSNTTQTSNHSSQLCQLIVQHTQTSNHSSQLCQLRVQHHPNKQLQLSVMPAHRPAPPKQATIALSYASSQSSTTQSSNHSSHYASSQSSTIQTRNYSSQLCQLIVQHHPNKQLQLSVMPAHSPAPPQTSNHSSQLCQLIVQHHPNKQLQLSVMPAHSPAPPKQATIALSYASSQSSTTQTSNYISQLCQLIVQHHPNKQLQLSVMPAHSPAPLKQAIIALSYASSQSSTTQTSKYSSQLCKLIVQHHPIKQLQLSVMPAHSPAPPKQATIALSYASSQSSTTQTSNLSSQLCQLIVQHHPNKQPQLSVMPVHSPAPPKQASIALSYASSQSSSTQTSNYSSQLCQLMDQHQTNKQIQLFVMPANRPAPPKQATIALSYASSWSSTKQTSNYSSLLCQLIDQHHPNKQLQLQVMPAHSPAAPNQATIALSYASSQPSTIQTTTIAFSYASSQSSTTQTSNYSSQSCQLIVQQHPNKQVQLSVMPAHSPAPLKQETIALSYASSQPSTIQTSKYSSQLWQLIVQHHPNKQPQLSVMPAHSPPPPKQATKALSYASSQSSTTQTSNYSSQLCQPIFQHHPNKQPQLSVMPAHSPAPSKQATKALSFASSQSSTQQTSNHSSQLCQLIVNHHPNKQLQLSVMPVRSPAPSKQATKQALSYASSQSSTIQTSNYSSQLGQLIVQHHQKHATIALSYASSQSSSNYHPNNPNKQLQLSVMPPKQAQLASSSTTQSSKQMPYSSQLCQLIASTTQTSSQSSTTQTSNYSSQLCQLIASSVSHSPAPPKQATIALSYASSQSSTTQSSNHSSQNASSQSSTTQRRNYSPQLCQLIVQHHSNKQLQLSVMPAHSPVPPNQATIALSYASSQSSTTPKSNYSSQLCLLIDQHHTNKQLYRSVMPAHSPAPPKQQIQLSVMPAHSPAPPKQATIGLSYASSQSTTIQTSNHSSELCLLIVQHHSNKQLQLSVMRAHGPTPPKQATIALSYANSQSSTPKQATIALSYASSESSTTQTSNYSSQLCQLIDQHHPNKQLQLSVMPAHSPAQPNQATIALTMPAHSPAPSKHATIALSYASSQSSTTQTSNYSSQLCQPIVQHHPKQATIALSYASSQSSTTQTSNHSSQLCQLIVQHHPNKQLQLSVMPAHSPAPPKQATISLSYASSQSSTIQTSNYSSQLCQLIVKHHPNKQLQLSVMPAHSPAPPKQATISLSYASSQSSTIQTSNQSSQLCQLIVQNHSNKQLQLSVMPAHSPAQPKQANIALSYASSQSSTTQSSNYSSLLCQLIVQHHPNKQPQLSVLPAHSQAPPKQATLALSYASSQSSTTQTTTIALSYASSQSSTTQTSKYSSQL